MKLVCTCFIISETIISVVGKKGKREERRGGGKKGREGRRRGEERKGRKEGREERKEGRGERKGGGGEKRGLMREDMIDCINGIFLFRRGYEKDTTKRTITTKLQQ